MSTEAPTRRRRPDQVAQPELDDTQYQPPVEKVQEPVLVPPFHADGVTVLDSEGRIVAVCGAAHQLMPTRARLAEIVAAAFNAPACTEQVVSLTTQETA